jgi:hypothetical protein
LSVAQLSISECYVGGVVADVLHAARNNARAESADTFGSGAEVTSDDSEALVGEAGAATQNTVGFGGTEVDDLKRL